MLAFSVFQSLQRLLVWNYDIMHLPTAPGEGTQRDPTEVKSFIVNLGTYVPALQLVELHSRYGVMLELQRQFPGGPVHRVVPTVSTNLAPTLPECVLRPPHLQFT
jgi:hypothetical protein